MQTFTVDDTYRVIIDKAIVEASKSETFAIEHDGDVYRAIVPSPLADKFSAGFNEEADAAYYLAHLRTYHANGRDWAFDDKVAVARALWSALGDVPVNEDGELEEAFYDFEEGCDREYIWGWFEETFDICIGKEFF
ncbi:MAG: hypothetical protein CMJ50_00045 [Planctomycetaceae bacterium]|nr:hypothetical protein [Planctomycetaceae bacterium]